MDEQKSQAVELTDEELEQVSGGSVRLVSGKGTCSHFKGSGEAICKNCSYMERVHSIGGRTLQYSCHLSITE
jgi:bacteriocin-like protein